MYDRLMRKFRLFVHRFVPRFYNLQDGIMIMWLDREFYFPKP